MSKIRLITPSVPTTPNFVLFASAYLSGVLKHSRNANLQSIATRIASREIERLRNLDFLSLPTTEPISDPELSKLPSSYGTRTVSDYSGNVNIKLINIRVNWNEKGTPQELTIETLISKHGI